MPSITDLFPELGMFGEEDFRRMAVPGKTVLIAITPRTGSTWLCSEFALRGNVGEVDEILNPRGPVQHARAWRRGMSFADYWRARSARAGQVFAFKTGWTDFSLFSQHATKLLPDLSVAYIDRRSIEAQALSQYVALETGVWHLKGEAKTARTLPHRLNLRKIDRIADRLFHEKAAWETFFRLNGIEPRRIFYEDFETDVEQGIAFLAAVAGLDIPPCRHPSTGFTKLSRRDPGPWLDEIKEHRRRIGT